MVEESVLVFWLAGHFIIQVVECGQKSWLSWNALMGLGCKFDVGLMGQALNMPGCSSKAPMHSQLKEHCLVVFLCLLEGNCLAELFVLVLCSSCLF